MPSFVAELRSGHLLSLADTRYVLVEPPHHVAPPRLEDLFFNLLVAGYVPILTHPERLTWIKSHYQAVQRLVQAGVWMQITAGSLAGAFGRNARYWAERMLDEGCVHILATDAHDVNRRPPNLSHGRELAAKRVGDVEAEHLVVTRPGECYLMSRRKIYHGASRRICRQGCCMLEASVGANARDVAAKGRSHN